MSQITQWYRKQPKIPQAFLRGIALVGTGSLAMVAYMTASGLMAGMLTFSPRTLQLSIMIAFLLLLGLLKALMLVIPGLSDPSAKLVRPVLTKWSSWVTALALFLAVRAFQMFLYIILPHGDTAQTTVNQVNLNHIFQSGLAGAAFVVMTALLLAPVMEELIFRWLPFRVLRNPWVAMIIGGLAFTLSHGPTTITAWLLYGSMAAALETMYYYWGLKGSLILHVMFNSTAILAMAATVVH